MNFIEFTYTKADGTESKRAVLPLVGPTKFVEGIDVSQMPEDEFVVFCRDFSALKSAQHEQTMAMLEQFDLKHNYRRFIPEQMSDITTDYV
jgi:hypothetical protein